MEDQVLCRIHLRIAPNARRSEICGEYGTAVKIKVAAPAVDGKANEALLEFLAESFGIGRRAISLISGEKSRDKCVSIRGLSEEAARARLLA